MKQYSGGTFIIDKCKDVMMSLKYLHTQCKRGPDNVHQLRVLPLAFYYNLKPSQGPDPEIGEGQPQEEYE